MTKRTIIWIFAAGLFALIALYVYFISPFWGKSFYEKNSTPIATEIAIKVHGEEELSILVEKAHLSKSNATFYVFGRVQFNPELERFKYVNVNCISLSVVLGGVEKNTPANVYDHGVAAIISSNLEYSKVGHKTWSLIYWAFPSSDLSDTEFVAAVKASAKLSSESQYGACPILANEKRSFN